MRPSPPTTRQECQVLEQFRKDVGSFVRLYDFLSQIINYGDTELERRSIFFKRLSRRIQTAAVADPFDTSDVSITKLKVIKREDADLKLGAGDPLKTDHRAGQRAQGDRPEDGRAFGGDRLAQRPIR